MWPRLVVFFDPAIQIGLQLVGIDVANASSRSRWEAAEDVT
jgi:hypothetical protein